MIEIREITNLDECKKVWNEISPNLSLYDDWDFRFAFYKHFNNPLRFFVGYENEKLIGLLPLQFNEEEGGYLGYFAEDFMEDNRLYIKPGYEYYIPEFYSAIKEDVMIDDIAGEDEFTRAMEIEDYKYVLPLEGLRTFEDHLEKSFNSKRRRQFLKSKNDIAALGVKSIQNNYDDIDLLFDLNIKRHGEESYLADPHKREIFKELVGLFDVRLATFEISGKKEGVSYSIFYKNTYNYLSVGSNIKAYSSLGAYIGMVNFDYAISIGAKIFDAGLGDCGWKHLWHFDKIPQYSYHKIGGKVGAKWHE